MSGTETTVAFIVMTLLVFVVVAGGVAFAAMTGRPRQHRRHSH